MRIIEHTRRGPAFHFLHVLFSLPLMRRMYTWNLDGSFRNYRNTYEIIVKKESAKTTLESRADNM